MTATITIPRDLAALLLHTLDQLQDVAPEPDQEPLAELRRELAECVAAQRARKEPS
jgi:hypothetical protein